MCGEVVLPCCVTDDSSRSIFAVFEFGHDDLGEDVGFLMWSGDLGELQVYRLAICLGEEGGDAALVSWIEERWNGAARCRCCGH